MGNSYSLRVMKEGLPDKELQLQVRTDTDSLVVEM
jgi:hypothetical protein